MGETETVTEVTDTPAVATETAAAVQTATQTTETQTDGEEKKPAAERTFTQSELDSIIQKEKAKAEAKSERRLLRVMEKFQPQQVQRQEVKADERPTRAQFADDDGFFDALTDWKLDQRDRGSNQRKAHEATQSLTVKTEKLYAEAAKIQGFDRDDFEALPLTGPIAQAITDSDVAPKLMAFMASNPDEVARIAGLSPARQAAEIGKLEVKLSAAVKTSKAATPIDPIGGSATTVRSLETSSFADYKAQREKQGAIWRR